ncbi:hypothetical protein KSD_49830 [Ktedonobacter sp. SOSP1-85]|uniref:hypothetical protein n=1 Tax=Ktedonobacter sp. SOSP1-85 TaxID=2778367 RepID=UPI001914F489|nr:hypothetical protein [Ktedonobacter sp. SOSP1-85]GHO77212.1 hypothetical protein KSD_49830 [Ktedonobacter sp. SOSP1-85]
MNNEATNGVGSASLPTAAIQALVRAGQEKFAQVFQAKLQSFDEMIWDVNGLKDRPGMQYDKHISFTRHGNANQALPQTYVAVVKSWLVLDHSSLGTMIARLAMARLLWEAILLRRGNDPAAFCWTNLCEEDLSQAELLMREHWKPSTVYQQGTRLLGMINFLAARSICRPLYYALQATRVGDFYRHTLTGQEERSAKLPSSRALEGVADIYNTYATRPADRLCSCALALLVVTGFRLGELLTLPLACEATEDFDGKERYRLRYYKEKARGAEKMLDIRWLTPTGTVLARKAIAEIQELTSPAHERARILEQDPNRVPVSGYQWADHIRPDELATLLGLKNRKSLEPIPKAKLPRHRENGRAFYRASEVEAYLLSERVEHLWTLDRRDGTLQMLSETLFIVYARSFHSAALPNPLLVEPLFGHDLSSFMAGHDRQKSAFERFDIREEHGDFCRITSHQFRHWLNDLADKGGLPANQQTRWFGRENPKDTQAYQHANFEERLQWVKDGIRNGEVCGTIAHVYFALPEDERDIFLEGQIQAVHFTPLGLCLHDFAIDPCSYYLNCTRKCPEYLRTKGNQQERINLIQVQRRTKQALELAQAQAATGNDEIAQAWIRHYEETLAGVEAALAIDDDPMISDGVRIQPFPNSPSRFQSL